MTEYLSCECCNAELATIEVFYGPTRGDGTIWLGNKCARLLQVFARITTGTQPKMGTPMRVVR